ncbi:MAG: glutamate--tRNA ligase [Candidatus Aenigmatarchaeota archaeon]|nr:MAG: glutamate--tRNA ligase [Candidatus Aenigmarchaeota archaeon]
MDLDTEILMHALRNALMHKGRANEGAVISKIIGAHPELRKDAKRTGELVKRVVGEVNSLSEPAQMEEALRLGVSLEHEAKPEREGLPDLPNAQEGAVVTRFAPNPSAPLHLGHSRALLLSGLYAKKYNGRFILRFDDTDPRTKTPMKEAYDWILEDVRWFGFEPDAIVHASDRMDTYYKYAVELLRKSHAYVCDCDTEKWKELTLAKTACPCRARDAGAQHERWLKMINGGYKEGEAVVRIKTDLNHADPAMRDWPALRIIDVPHTRTGTEYRVWPLYNLASAIDDHEFGVTHVFRGQEHQANAEKQAYLFKHMGWKEPDVATYGRLFVKGIALSKSEIVKGMKAGTYNDWEDPRLGTLRALRRRGFQPETLVHLIEHVGIKPNNATISMENLAAENKKFVDFRANRYYFVASPVEFTLSGKFTKKTAEVALHPEDEARGARTLNVKSKILLDEKDVDAYGGKEVRLKGLFNVKVDVKNKTLTYTGEALERETPKIHWLPAEETVACTIVMDDASVLQGKAEKGVTNELIGNTVQFERFGFVRIDNKEPFAAYFSHK